MASIVEIKHEDYQERKDDKANANFRELLREIEQLKKRIAALEEQ